MKHRLHGENNCLGFIEAVPNGYESRRTTDQYLGGTLFSNVNNIQSVIKENQKSITTQ